ncbi:phage major capsid protein [Pseudomonas aeruginosa]|nr:phage major capsid protein [Pseudomonas aeruginosa]
MVKSHDGYKALQQKSANAADIEVTKSDLASMKETKVTSAGIVVPNYDPTIQPGIRQELRIRDLLTSIPVSGQSYTYYRELLHTRGAGPVAEGALKPTSNVTFESVTDRVKKLAVWMPVTDEALDDVPQLFGYIQELLRYDLKLEEEAQILKGDGTGENLNGLMTQATTYDTALNKAGDTSIDIVRRGIYQVRKQSKGTADAGDMTLTVGLDNGDAGQLALKNAHADRSKGNYNIRITLNDGLPGDPTAEPPVPAVPPTTFYFGAKVMNNTVAAGSADNVVRRNVTLGINTEILEIPVAI